MEMSGAVRALASQPLEMRGPYEPKALGLCHLHSPFTITGIEGKGRARNSKTNGYATDVVLCVGGEHQKEQHVLPHVRPSCVVLVWSLSLLLSLPTEIQAAACLDPKHRKSQASSRTHCRGWFMDTPYITSKGYQ